MLKKNNKLAWLLLLPGLIIMLGLVFYPIVRTFEFSLYEYNLTKPDSIFFTGFDNYFQVFNDSNFYIALKNTLLMSVFIIIISFFGSIFVALILNQHTKVTPILTAFAILPWTLPPLVNGIIWDFIFYSGYGLINKILIGIGIIDTPILWANQTWTVMLIVAIVVSWRVIPMCAIILLSHLQNIPQTYYEVSQVEGSGMIRTFFDITLPIIKSSLIIILMQITIAALNVFDEIVSLVGFTLGDQTLLIYNYMNLFTYMNFGFGSAITYVIMVLSALIGVFYIASMTNQEEVNHG